MHSVTGDLYRFAAENDEALSKLTESLAVNKIFPITESQYDELAPLEKPKRKNVMRNKPCVCGSGNKFKRCCWSKYA